MAGAILVLNAGSSSLKFSVFLDGEPRDSARVIRQALDELGDNP
jgi:acetate kinase